MTRLFIINEGITYIEDLNLDKFMDIIDNFSDLDISEKVDGSELTFGFDNDYKFYTTRSGKGGTVMNINYKTTEYLIGGGGPTFAAAHEALQKVVKQIKTVMKAGEAVEIEVLYGRQPNAIVYGLNDLNFITFLRAVEGTDSTLPVRKELPGLLEKALKGEDISIISNFQTSSDGLTLQQETVPSKWSFTEVPKINPADIDTADVKKKIEGFRKYLQEGNKVAIDLGLQLSNFEIATINLTQVPMEFREDIKKERDQVNVTILSEYKLPIKDALLDSFNNIKSKFQGTVKNNEFGGVEGVVFVDPKTDEITKLVDKNEFTSVNQFNYRVRKELFSVVRTTDQDASLEAKGGIVGKLKYRIMSLLGIPEATRGFNLKKLLSQFDGTSPEDTLTKFAAGYSNVNPNAFRQKISAMIQSTIDEIVDKLVEFKKDYPTYKLKLKHNKEIGYTDEVVKRTLLSFAEVHKYLQDYKDEVNKTSTIEELLKVIVGSSLNRIHDNDELNESVKVKRTPEKQLAWIDNKSVNVKDILKGYLFNYLAVLFLCKLKDKISMLELVDQRGAYLKHQGKSYFNQLGYVVFYPNDNQQYLKPKAIKPLSAIAKKITLERRRNIHSQVSSSSNNKLDFSQANDSLKLLIQHFELDDKFFTRARVFLNEWADHDIEKTEKFLKRLIIKLREIDDNSVYAYRLREAMFKMIKKGDKGTKMLLKEIAQLTEDGEGSQGAPGGVSIAPAAAGPAMGTVSNAIAPTPFKLFKGKIIKRIPRKIQKRKKFAKRKQSIADDINKKNV